MSTATIIKPITGVVFGDDEPVLQSHPLTDGVNVPTFATTSTWTLAAAGRPANRMPSAWALRFAKLDPVWNLRVREVAMVMLNPTHPAVVASGVHIDPRPASVGSVTAAVADLRRLAAWAATQGLPASLRAWQPDHVRRYVEQRRTEIAAGTLMRTVTTIGCCTNSTRC